MTTTPPRFPVASTTTLRSLHLSGGLFDTGVTGKAGFLSATLNTPDVLKTIDASTLFCSPAGEAVEIPLDGTGLEHLGDEVPLVELTANLSEDVYISKDFSTSGTESEFLEGFCDLSAYLEEGGVSLPDMMEVSSEGIKQEDTGHMVKRTADVAFTSVAPLTPNTDHDHYTSKPKKPRFSFSESDAESTISADTSATSATKYQERRKKNNIASRRSRETRKQKFISMECQAVELATANAKLEAQVTELESLTKLMKSILVKKLAGDA